MTSASNDSNINPSLLPVEELRWYCPPEKIPAETTEGVEPIEGIIGQDRALKALKLGVELDSPGYNVFVCGLSGTGKATTIKSILEKIQPRKERIRDYCYVNCFENSDTPSLLSFERGQGMRFKKDMEEAVRLLRERMPRIFEDDEFLKKRQQYVDDFRAQQAALFESFEEEITPQGFVLARVQDGQTSHPDLMVRIGDKAVGVADLEQAVAQDMLTEEAAEEYAEKYNALRPKLDKVFRDGVQISKQFKQLLIEHERSEASFLVHAVFADMLQMYTTERVQSYLVRLIDHLLDNLDDFKQDEGEEAEVPVLTAYEVNLLLDNSTAPDCPVVIETNPTLRNIFGTIERRQDAQGFWYQDFTMVKPGSLLRADGGFLVLNAADALTEPGVWKNLQRVLLYRKHEIQNIETYSQQSFSALKPEGIDINVKVILIGNNEIYNALSAYERDFKKIFKVKADFDYEMPNSDQAVQQYSALVRKLVHDEDLKHFDRKAIAGIVEYGARLVDSRKKVTTQFSEIADIVREADYWCRQNSNRYVTTEHVDKAITETRNRHSLYEEKLQEMIDDETILIDVEGARTGQINGLAVYGGERFSFGKPSRITATVSAGKSGIINIEREARMSGRTHDKGVLILSGFLRERFAQNHPLALSASVSFEQSYSGVDGDSASSTEMYALLSAIAGLPLRQDIAVTGSVNQKGDIQPIGGVNEKIEGFYSVCQRRGLTGTQGVIIPRQNVANLMLQSEVVRAVRDGRFHVWAIERIEEGVELLMGKPAGTADSEGRYAEDSVFRTVQVRLDELYEIARRKEDALG